MRSIISPTRLPPFTASNSSMVNSRAFDSASFEIGVCLCICRAPGFGDGSPLIWSKYARFGLRNRDARHFGSRTSRILRRFPDQASPPFRPQQVAPFGILLVMVRRVDDAVGTKTAEIFP